MKKMSKDLSKIASENHCEIENFLTFTKSLKRQANVQKGATQIVTQIDTDDTDGCEKVCQKYGNEKFLTQKIGPSVSICVILGFANPLFMGVSRLEKSICVKCVNLCRAQSPL